MSYGSTTLTQPVPTRLLPLTSADACCSAHCCHSLSCVRGPQITTSIYALRDAISSL